MDTPTRHLYVDRPEDVAAAARALARGRWARGRSGTSTRP